MYAKSRSSISMLLHGEGAAASAALINGIKYNAEVLPFKNWQESFVDSLNQMESEDGLKVASFQDRFNDISQAHNDIQDEIVKSPAYKNLINSIRGPGVQRRIGGYERFFSENSSDETATKILGGYQSDGSYQNWTEDQLNKLSTSNKILVDPGENLGKHVNYQGHHGRAISKIPFDDMEKMYDPDNIRIMTPKAHLKVGHEGNFHNTSTDPYSEITGRSEDIRAEERSHFDITYDILISSFHEASTISLAIEPLVSLNKKDRAEALILNNLSYKSDDLNTHLLLARYYEVAGEYEKSFDVWERISFLSLKSKAKYFYDLIRVALHKKDYIYAEEELTRFLKLHSADNLARYQLGMTYYQQRKFKLCIPEFLKVQKIKQSKYMIGMSYQKMELHKKAAESFVAYANQFEPEQLDKYFYFTYSIACCKSQDYIEMDRCFELLLRYYGKDSDVKNFIGYMWADLNVKLVEALKLIREAVRIDPNVAHLDSLLWVLYKLGSYDDALLVVSRIDEFKCSDVDAIIFDHIGDVYAAVGDSSLAKVYWQKALQSESEEADFKSIKEKLNN